jgi:hypothetical protein
MSASFLTGKKQKSRRFGQNRKSRLISGSCTVEALPRKLLLSRSRN